MQDSIPKLSVVMLKEPITDQARVSHQEPINIPGMQCISMVHGV